MAMDITVFVGKRCNNNQCSNNPNFPYPICGTQFEGFPEFVDIEPEEVGTIVDLADAQKVPISITGGEPSLYSNILNKFVDCVAEKPKKRSIGMLSNLNWAKSPGSKNFKEMKAVFKNAKAKRVRLNVQGSIDNYHGNLETIETVLSNVKAAGGHLFSNPILIGDSDITYYNKPKFKIRSIYDRPRPYGLSNTRSLLLVGAAYTSAKNHENEFKVKRYDNKILKNFKCDSIRAGSPLVGVVQEDGGRYFSFYPEVCPALGKYIEIGRINVDEFGSYSPEGKKGYFKLLIQGIGKNENLQKLRTRGGITGIWEKNGEPPLLALVRWNGIGHGIDKCEICHQALYGRP